MVLVLRFCLSVLVLFVFLLLFVCFLKRNHSFPETESILLKVETMYPSCHTHCTHGHW